MMIDDILIYLFVFIFLIGFLIINLYFYFKVLSKQHRIEYLDLIKGLLPFFCVIALSGTLYYMGYNNFSVGSFFNHRANSLFLIIIGLYLSVKGLIYGVRNYSSFAIYENDWSSCGFFREKGDYIIIMGGSTDFFPIYFGYKTIVVHKSKVIKIKDNKEDTISLILDCKPKKVNDISHLPNEAVELIVREYNGFNKDDLWYGELNQFELEYTEETKLKNNKGKTISLQAKPLFELFQKIEIENLTYNSSKGIVQGDISASKVLTSNSKMFSEDKK